MDDQQIKAFAGAFAGETEPNAARGTGYDCEGAKRCIHVESPGGCWK